MGEAIQLAIIHDGIAEVSIEVNDGVWVTVIRERHIDGGITGHIVEPAGIERAIAARCTCLGSQGGPDYCEVHAA